MGSWPWSNDILFLSLCVSCAIYKLKVSLQLLPFAMFRRVGFALGCVGGGGGYVLSCPHCDWRRFGRSGGGGRRHTRDLQPSSQTRPKVESRRRRCRRRQRRERRERTRVGPARRLTAPSPAALRPGRDQDLVPFVIRSRYALVTLLLLLLLLCCTVVAAAIARVVSAYNEVRR